MVYVRIHVHENDRILAACDEDILGMTFRGGGARITVSERFYCGESVSEETFLERTRSASVINMVGNAVIGVAVREGLVSADCVMDIGGVKHAQVVMM
ncbi:MAG: DUF424 family protein [Euryarchaeota archaeon]|jgi:hypothetical protein|nr:DUF424 family protein [Euryarchaeota archaeon]